jgi:D-inositol-3-phosphate glycosyltransferase
LIAKQISEELNIPYVFTSHSLGVFLDGYNKERVDCEKIVMNSSSITTASSDYETNLIINNYNIDEKNIRKISPGIDREIFTYDSNLERENILLSVGRIQEQKRQIDVLKFIDNFRKIDTNFLCYFVGGPSGKSGDEYLIQLKNVVKELNIGSNIEFLGNLTQAEIKLLMNKSKLLIHTSQFETFGLVAIEANTMGVPVLTTNTGSLTEIIEHNKNGYISSKLIDGKVNNFVKNLLTDDKKFNEISSYCLENSKKYDWENTSKKLVDIYEGLI